MSRRWLLVVTVLLTGCATVTENTTPTTATTRPGPRSTTTTPDLSSTTTTVPEAIPSAEDILVDGEVSDEERELARWAVFTCLEEAGAETTFELYDVDPVVSRDFFDELEECRLPYVGLYRENRMPGDQFQLGLLGVVECTEDETGRDYGPKTVDEIGRLTPESHRTITAALNTDRPVYQGCYFDLYIAESRVLVDPEILGYRLDGDDPKRLLLRVAGCGYITSGMLVHETDQAVFVTATSVHIEEGPVEPCWLLHPIRLSDPIGDRRVVHDRTRAIIEEIG